MRRDGDEDGYDKNGNGDEDGCAVRRDGDEDGCDKDGDDDGDIFFLPFGLRLVSR